MTPEPKKSGASSVGSYTTTGIPLAFTRFMTPLDGARAEVVGVALHGEAVNPDHRHGLAGVDKRHHAVDHDVGDMVLARAV